VSSFCEQKEAKKLYDCRAWDLAEPTPHPGAKVFLLLFLQKKKFSLSLSAVAARNAR
jgi:hypothetical protein